MATRPSSCAGVVAKEPRKAPTGVRFAAVMTTSVMLQSSGLSRSGSPTSLPLLRKARPRAAPRARSGRGCRRSFRRAPGQFRVADRPAPPSLAERSCRRSRRSSGAGRGSEAGSTTWPATRQAPRPGRSFSRKSSNISRAAASGTGGPSFAQSSSVTKVRASSLPGSIAAKRLNLPIVRAGSRLQKALCSTSIGSSPSDRTVTWEPAHRSRRPARSSAGKPENFQGAAMVATPSTLATEAAPNVIVPPRQ